MSERVDDGTGEPAGAQRLTRCPSAGLLLDVRDAGPADGPPVLLLHGFPQDRTSWDRLAPALHAAGLRTLAPDQRGYSPGARPRGRGAYRLELLVEDAVAVLDAAGVERAHVLGHDWGGIVAWALAAHRPERTAALTVASVPHPRALSRSLVRSGQGLRSAYVAAFQLPRLPETVLGPRLGDLLRRSGLPAAEAARYAARMQQPGALTAALDWYRAVPLSRLRTGPVDVPTTYAWGNRDLALGRRAAELTAGHVRGPYRFVELDAGHWLPETRPEQLAALVVARAGGAG
ncbi:alpha/beta fold hydrolase [Kocuria turfanensis]|uniref:Alpha/beta hydrolase n=1 Tax=Kocuria turfanensis TaxID=388357 RepID=A0A512ICF6_9MICC|nr:alpha/beta fold hydrolase [Kocuria turfanensis]GEO95383.1 alpha/beta hydrolase [Kocuria turfanensis]